jgi:Zn finger protein HypA/HybF involved in hydrogenase expression
MSNDDLIIESFNCTDCGTMFKLHHNEIQESQFCPFCGNSSIEAFDGDEMPWEPNFDDPFNDKEWD